MAKELSIGRTDRASAGSGRGNHAASAVARHCLPPEEHDGENACAVYIQPRHDRVLIRRIEEPSAILLTDREKSIKGIVLAVGPGRWVEGTWWYHEGKTYNKFYDFRDEGYYWIPGYHEPMTLKPGMKVLFSSKYNDLANAELKAMGSDVKSKTTPLERPLNYKFDPLVHLVTERDIFGILEA